MPRTTLSLEPDVAAALERRRRERGTTLKKEVNELLRLGMELSSRPAAAAERFETEPLPLGKPLLESFDDVAGVLDSPRAKTTVDPARRQPADLRQRSPDRSARGRQELARRAPQRVGAGRPALAQPARLHADRLQPAALRGSFAGQRARPGESLARAADDLDPEPQRRARPASRRAARQPERSPPGTRRAPGGAGPRARPDPLQQRRRLRSLSRGCAGKTRWPEARLSRAARPPGAASPPAPA